MKKFAAVVVVIAIGAGLFFAFKPKHSTPENPPASTLDAPAAEPRPVVPATIAPTENSKTVAPAAVPANSPAAQAVPAATSATMGISSLPPATVLDNARVVMKNYDSAFGENPVGTNPEITEALLGKNPKGINFITPESGLRVNEQGEMVDAWGTPFFFHQLSGQEMEIHSAGPDRKMWTSDDLITR
jgi:hypothetical protein